MVKKMLWRWSDVCEAVGVNPESGADVSGISIDSRTLDPGDLFIALPGDPGPRFNTHYRSNRHGNDFVADAAARGAAGAVVTRPQPVDMPQIVVQDTLDALWALGRAARARLRCAVIGVTGSSGKTTVKTLLSAALGCPASAASYNNFLGVPLSLARTPADASAAVFEIGTNHPGEIAPLSMLVRPDVALVLNVMPVHIENFPSMDALRQEKLGIAEGLPAGGTLVVYEDLAPLLAPERAAQLRVVTYGESDSADVRLADYDPGQRVAAISWKRREVQSQGERGSLIARVPGGGRHRALSLTASMACLLAAGFDPARGADLSDELIPAGRGRIHDLGGICLIDDSYNANPISMAHALNELASMKSAAGGKGYAIVGEMLELGAESARYHRELAAACAPLDGVFCVGAGMKVLFDALPAGKRLGFADHASAIELDPLVACWRPGDRILVKGSNRVFWANQFVPRLVDALHAAVLANKTP
jgi:UDP-N-acetylmuramoyl-tripeptide--D-alanyl-D-alanine ligase